MSDATFQLSIWGWCVTGRVGTFGLEDARAQFRAGQLALLVEGGVDLLDGWWDRDLAYLWSIKLGDRRDTPERYALAGARW